MASQDTEALNNHFFEFKRKFLEFGIAKGMYTEENRRNILDRAPTAEEEHDAKIMDKMLYTTIERF